MSNVTENLHLEQERTKYIYQDRHNNNCPLSSRLPLVGVASNTTIRGRGEGRRR